MLSSFENRSPGIVVGNGLIGDSCRRLGAERLKALFFASGVSDSSCVDSEQFLREQSLLECCLQQYTNLPLVYFSSASIYDGSINRHSAYVSHKLQMERLVSARPPFLICRVTQIIGKSTNRKTIFSHFYKSIVNRERVQVQRYARRNFIDVDDMVGIMLEAFRTGDSCNQFIDIGSLRYDSPKRLLELLGARLGIEPIFDIVDGGGSFDINPAVSTRFSGSLGVSFDEQYLPAVIAKYVSPPSEVLQSVSGNAVG